MLICCEVAVQLVDVVQHVARQIQTPNGVWVYAAELRRWRKAGRVYPVVVASQLMQSITTDETA